MQKLANISFLLLGISCTILTGARPLSAEQPMPEGFVDVSKIVPRLVVDLRYLSDENFVGGPIDGYLKPRCILTRKAAMALRDVQSELAEFGMGLKVFDAYRPQQAVDHFVRWSNDASAMSSKAKYYPRVDKNNLFLDGYIAAKSSHSRGSTVDLTIVTFQNDDQPPVELDMGTPFDFFGPESWGNHSELSAQQKCNRLLLRALMQKHRFRPYAKEWWHFTLDDEPYPKKYFNFPVQ
ncbi:M15 family metallopeptidase [Adhaeretor mobilis]|uniref:D-alanyl-D-alanine dipeptidase n=1 Tax=Adhaeretor mobilis TaxID=1930276 RepID=A0A517MV56_9BACT|nr:M15 family metallopeptidase [Adhaeretor mobilis]QDS98756.1 D-alanyl-D-alanine dipeptidase [Adhaeretor mobilis]